MDIELNWGDKKLLDTCLEDMKEIDKTESTLSMQLFKI